MDGLIKEFHVDKLHVSIYKTRRQMGMALRHTTCNDWKPSSPVSPQPGLYSQQRSQEEFLQGLLKPKTPYSTGSKRSIWTNTSDCRPMHRSVSAPSSPRDFRPETFPQGLSDGLRAPETDVRSASVTANCSGAHRWTSYRSESGRTDTSPSTTRTKPASTIPKR